MSHQIRFVLKSWTSTIVSTMLQYKVDNESILFFIELCPEFYFFLVN